MTPAIVLLSGGLDSAVTLASVIAAHLETHALSFEYGQRHGIEIASARRIAEAMHVKEHKVIQIDLRVFGGSALTGDIAVPEHRSTEKMQHGVPVTYVPARNTIFLSYALAWAETLECSDIFVGVNAIDYSGYPDCRPEFLAAFENLASLATKAGVEGTRFRIQAPLLRLRKAEIIRKGTELGVDFSLTHSCYDPAPEGTACGRCDSCQLRLKGFVEAGLVDPIRYTDK